jgi:uncharacterized protein (TIGR02147 family)
MSVFEFTNIPAFLQSYRRQLGAKSRGEASRMARHLGVSSTLISQVLSNQKPLTMEQGHKLLDYLGLTDLEADYFIFLLQLQRAGSVEAKKFWNKKLEAIKRQSTQVAERVRAERVLDEQQRAVFYSSPLYSAIRLYTSLGQGKTLEDVVDRFELSRARAAEILKFLTETGLCSSADGRYLMSVQSTHLEQGSPHLTRHHSHWRIRAIHQSEDLAEQELMYTAPVSLSYKDFESLREEMVVFIKKFLTRVHDSSAEEIACFNMDFFWIRK